VELSQCDITSFDCSNIGTNTVTLTATDVNGNSSSSYSSCHSCRRDCISITLNGAAAVDHDAYTTYIQI
jgi:hypothetical protein